jgi:hypothetical protein
MKIKELLLEQEERSTLGKGFYGKELNLLKDYFNKIDEFKNKNVTIIDDLGITNPTITLKNGTPELNCDYKIPVSNVFDVNQLKDDIKIFAIFLTKNNDVIYRVTKDSFIS